MKKETSHCILINIKQSYVEICFKNLQVLFAL